MADTKLKPEEIDGKTYDIYVDDSGEFFHVSKEGDRIKADTRAALVKKLRASGRRKAVRVAVPATLWEPGRGWASKEHTTEDVTLTGIHGSNGNLLIKRANGETEQASDWRTKLLRALTPDEKRALISASKTAEAATSAFNALLTKYEINGKDAVRKAMAQAGLSGEDIDG